jgi:hypothetical protein
VVTVVATSPNIDQRPGYWPLFVLAGAVVAMTMLVGAFMTLNLYLHPEEDRHAGQRPEPELPVDAQRADSDTDLTWERRAS